MNIWVVSSFWLLFTILLYALNHPVKVFGIHVFKILYLEVELLDCKVYVLEKEMATHSSILAWRIPGMGEPRGLPSMGSHRVGRDWGDLAAAAAGYVYTTTSLLSNDKLFVSWLRQYTYSPVNKSSCCSTSSPKFGMLRL